MIIKENSRELSRPIWFTVTVILLLSAIRLCVEYIEEFDRLCQNFVDMALAQTMVDLLVFWLLGTVWVAYRRWRDALLREQELRRVISSISPDVLMVVEPDRNISTCNAAVMEMFGYTPEEVIGGRTEKLYGDRRIHQTPGEIFQCLERIGFHVGFAAGKHKDGHTVPLEIVTGKLSGRPGVVVLIRDITRRERAEKELLIAKVVAERATQEKTEALALLEANYRTLQGLELMRDRLTDMLVHDLKSPLATIRGYLDMIASENAQSGALSEDSARSLAAARRVAVHLREMVLSLLDLSRLEKQAMDLRRSPTDLAALIREATGLLGSEEAAGMVDLSVADEGVVIPCDANVIRRVVMNLLDNAVKFSPVDGTVRVTLSRDDSQARISVTDSGPGVPEEFREKIFDHFAQVDARGYSTGIGLSFCRLAMRAHGGDISLERSDEKGSTFTLSLPLQAVDGGLQDNPVDLVNRGEAA